jgi:sterol desaturase/sphingolipid hydroxylase (fatty acid hydroxylase superfamily)
VAVDFESLPAVTTLAAPFFALSVAIEWLGVKTGRLRGDYQTRDALTSLAMGVGNVVVNTLTGTLFLSLLMLAWPYRAYTLPFTWLTFAAGFVLYDLVYYWKHRFAHRVRWWWMEHVTHHSSTHYNLTTALRQPWYGPFTGLYLLGIPMVLLGFHPGYIGLIAGFNLVYQFWIHTEAVNRMPLWFEAIFNTPSHHRVHHATNARYLDANYAGVFIIWDKMFGSFVPELDADRPSYGIVKPVGSFNPLWVAFHEFFGLVRDCAGDGLRPWHWIRRAINAPGWSPDGNHQRSIELKREFVKAHPEQKGTPGLKV